MHTPSPYQTARIRNACAWVWIAICWAGWFGAPGVHAQNLDRTLRLNGSRVLMALEEPYKGVRSCVVELMVGDEVVALGTILTEDGWLVAKASQFLEALEVRVASEERFTPTTVRVDDTNDLGFLKIDAQGLMPVPWGESEKEDWARIVFAPIQDVSQIRMGLVSTSPYAVQQRPGVLGVILPKGEDEVPSGVLVENVAEQSAAALAGLAGGDRIQQVNGRDVRRSEDVVSAIQEHAPGEAVSLRILREGKSFDQRVVLGDYNWWNLNEVISGDFSKRRSGFDRVIQHDTPLPPRAMGGPLFDLSARALGINIARSDRLTTLALPAELVQSKFRQARGLDAPPSIPTSTD